MFKIVPMLLWILNVLLTCSRATVTTLINFSGILNFFNASINLFLIEVNVHEIRKRKAHWIGHILRRNCLLKQVIEGKIKGRIEVKRRRGRRRKQLLDDLGDRRGYSHLKEEAVDRIKWRNRFGRGCGPVIWEITDEWMKCCTLLALSLKNP
jgi:hypothetical protein